MTHGGQASGLRLNPQPIVSEPSTGTMPALSSQNSTDSEGSQVTPNSSALNRQNSTDSEVSQVAPNSPALNRQNSTDSEGSQVAPNSSVSRQNSTNSLAPATPPTEPDPSKVPLSEMDEKTFISEAAMKAVTEKLGLSGDELSKFSAALKKINESNEIDTAQKSVINDYLRTFVLHVAFYVDSKEKPEEDTELKQDIKDFVEKLSKMSNSSVEKVLKNCIWQDKGSLKKIMSKIAKKIVEENTKNITPPEGIIFNEYRDSFATRLLFKYLLINIIYPERARIMKAAGYNLNENEQCNPRSLFKEDVVVMIESLIGEKHLLRGETVGLEESLLVSIAWKLLTAPAPGSEDPAESGTNSDGSDGGGGAPLQSGQPAPAVPPTSGGGGGEPVSSNQPLPLFPEVPPGNLEAGAETHRSGSRKRVKEEEKVLPDASHQVQPDDDYHTVAVKRTTIQPLQPLFPEKVFVDDELDESSHDPAPAQRSTVPRRKPEELVEPVIVPQPDNKPVGAKVSDITDTTPKSVLGVKEKWDEVKIPDRLITSVGSSTSKSGYVYSEQQNRVMQINRLKGFPQSEESKPTFHPEFEKNKEGKWVRRNRIPQPEVDR
ncbi:hypothetical protein [Candidatus Regiella insecticola]|uniref:hypothetical protein n=1 Tax=Candidatus Regiella insecticola TaxID=138073 RepID=UPI0030DB0309